VIGGPRFYERQEIRDALAYLRLVNSPSDDLAFERIINRPKRGIGDATIQTLHLAARAEGIPLLAAARRIIDTDELGPRIRTALKALIASFDRWTALARTASQTVLAETVLDESGYTQMWQNDKSPDAPGRLDNLKELVRSMEPFENLAGFLEHVSLVMEAVDADTQDKISLMTLHAAKGLEFDTVFLPGWEEGLFPSQRTMDESGIAGLEEERRLAYVGLTRAKKRAQISFVANRRIHGSWAAAIPSRFIDEIPKEMVETEIDQGLYGGYEGYGRLNRMNESTAQGSYETPGWKRFQAAGKPQGNYRAPPTIEGEARLIATSDPAASRFSRGERVFHQKFGYGRITMIDGNKLTVDFEKAGEKRVVDSFVQRV
jgi:DNA helicase-2/ATP-dependent DNA helicase PcrA